MPKGKKKSAKKAAARVKSKKAAGNVHVAQNKFGHPEVRVAQGTVAATRAGKGATARTTSRKAASPVRKAAKGRTSSAGRAGRRTRSTPATSPGASST